ncbi:MAG TPA: Ppx/GppA phosphatase family protein [Thermoanaerobaculaceae bacterium]|nr:Ppx/GppA phosphatase family protein [Thermoanaerobaculaceae bacterium]
MSETRTKKGREAAKLPLRVAALDVGSNAIRFAVNEFRTPSEAETLRSERVAVRLGHDVFLSGRLTGPAMDAAVAAIATFAETLKALRVGAWRAVATSAVRESTNGDEFVTRVERETGIRLEIIAGIEEARLVHFAVRNRLRLGADRWLMADLGGGSVEVSLVDGSGVLWSESHTIGSVRLLEELTQAGEEPGRFAELLAEYVAALRLPLAGAQRNVAGFIATGGNIETLARLAEPDADGTSPVRLPLERLDGLVKTLSRMSFRERMENLGLREDRADVILPAALVYRRLCHLSGCGEITVPFVGLREGVMLDLVEEALAYGARRARREQETLTAAVALGRHYAFDEAHSVHVARLAVSLFDQLESLHGLGETERRILLSAAVLHDIGQFVSFKRHHKHSFYLVANSELPGLSEREMLLVANVARYHRKGEPSASHEGLVDLDADERALVGKLASILRLADALDREHQQLVREVEARLDGRELVLRLRGTGAMLLEQWALKKKTEFFTNVFDLKVRVA